MPLRLESLPTFTSEATPPSSDTPSSSSSDAESPAFLPTPAGTDHDHESDEVAVRIKQSRGRDCFWGTESSHAAAGGHMSFVRQGKHGSIFVEVLGSNATMAKVDTSVSNLYNYAPHSEPRPLPRSITTPNIPRSMSTNVDLPAGPSAPTSPLSPKNRPRSIQLPRAVRRLSKILPSSPSSPAPNPAPFALSIPEDEVAPAAANSQLRPAPASTSPVRHRHSYAEPEKQLSEQPTSPTPSRRSGSGFIFPTKRQSLQAPVSSTTGTLPSNPTAGSPSIERCAFPSVENNASAQAQEPETTPLRHNVLRRPRGSSRSFSTSASGFFNGIARRVSFSGSKARRDRAEAVTSPLAKREPEGWTEALEESSARVEMESPTRVRPRMRDTNGSESTVTRADSIADTTHSLAPSGSPAIRHGFESPLAPKTSLASFPDTNSFSTSPSASASSANSLAAVHGKNLTRISERENEAWVTSIRGKVKKEKVKAMDLFGGESSEVIDGMPAGSSSQPMPSGLTFSRGAIGTPAAQRPSTASSSFARSVDHVQESQVDPGSPTALRSDRKGRRPRSNSTQLDFTKRPVRAPGSPAIPIAATVAEAPGSPRRRCSSAASVPSLLSASRPSTPPGHRGLMRAASARRAPRTRQSSACPSPTNGAVGYAYSAGRPRAVGDGRPSGGGLTPYPSRGAVGSGSARVSNSSLPKHAGRSQASLSPSLSETDEESLATDDEHANAKTSKTSFSSYGAVSSEQAYDKIAPLGAPLPLARGMVDGDGDFKGLNALQAGQVTRVVLGESYPPSNDDDFEDEEPVDDIRPVYLQFG